MVAVLNAAIERAIAVGYASMATELELRRIAHSAGRLLDHVGH
jgi:hypothetical protein